MNGQDFVYYVAYCFVFLCIYLNFIQFSTLMKVNMKELIYMKRGN